MLTGRQAWTLPPGQQSRACTAAVVQTKSQAPTRGPAGAPFSSPGRRAAPRPGDPVLGGKAIRAAVNPYTAFAISLSLNF